MKSACDLIATCGEFKSVPQRQHSLVRLFYWRGVRLIQQSSVVQLQSHHRNKPDLRPVSLCVCLEVEAAGRLGFPVEGVG